MAEVFLIIEDERPAANRLRRMLEELYPQAQIPTHLDSITSTVRYLQNQPAPDLLFCDIQLADGLSFEIFSQIKISSPIIFTTAYDQYAIKAFKVNALDYLLKPIAIEDLDNALKRFFLQKKDQGDWRQLQEMLLNLKGDFSNQKSYKSRFMVKFGEKIQAVEIQEAAFFFSEAKVTYLQTFQGRRFVIDYTLEQLEGMLDPKDFFRLNRKYLAAFGAIEEIYTYSNSRLKVTLKHASDIEILVSREKVGELKMWLDR